MRGMACPDDTLKNRLIETLQTFRERFSGRDVTATIDERGRMTIKRDDRKALGIDGKTAVLDLHVQVLEVQSNQMNGDGDD